ncbi:mitochondrial import inner membrane translocase subunit TIM16 [Coemansia aciculifera]|uniref:Mitochondrial import inner membrane translocase subunit TIM16 n=1 Tax=Coemansia aciculifera TaxID=417176 RepID=A0ACC1M8U7_9FUNG|nr:mitochondrial import inner membrane translocase subunit TIM16 [Coemansia aciculifera]KAJ2910999.1 mitochondrial import inner membrane translocase subunit TIM16 [Coemansia aciculifera]
MSAPKAIVQMLMTGTRIVGRAFSDAYKQAAVNSAAARAAAGNMKASADGDRMTQASGITVEESVKILNIPDADNKEELAKKFEHLFNANDPKQGGSIYLQSKVVRARERIEMHWAQEKLKAEQDLLAAANEAPAENHPPDVPPPKQ